MYGEAAGRWFADRTDLSVICLRFGAVTETPLGPVGGPFWLSFGDLGRLVRGALSTDVKYGIYYGGSANARDRWNLAAAARDLGYHPEDDSSDYEIDMSLPLPACYIGSV